MNFTFSCKCIYTTFFILVRKILFLPRVTKVHQAFLRTSDNGHKKTEILFTFLAIRFCLDVCSKQNLDYLFHVELSYTLTIDIHLRQKLSCDPSYSVSIR